MKKYLAEFIGTFALVFCGTGAIIVNEQSNGSLGLIGIVGFPKKRTDINSNLLILNSNCHNEK